LRGHFARVERHHVSSHVVFPDRAAALAYVRASVSRAFLADRLPPFEGSLRATRAVTVFVADKAP
jgi:hypothetical protein